MTTTRRWFRSTFRSQTLLVVLSLPMAIAVIAARLAHAGADDQRPLTSDDWVRQRRLLLLKRTVIAEPNRRGQVGIVPGLPWEIGYQVLRYVPDWESEDNLVPFRLLTGEKLDQRLSPEEVERIQAIFPEARLRSYAERRSEGPCACWGRGK